MASMHLYFWEGTPDLRQWLLSAVGNLGLGLRSACAFARFVVSPALFALFRFSLGAYCKNQDNILFRGWKHPQVKQLPELLFLF